MKITPDYKNRNDEYDDDTVRYYEKVDEDGYFYELYVMVDGVKSAIIITDDGVSIDFRGGENEGGSIHTNISPKKLFPEQKELSWESLEKIMKIIEKTDMEGKSYTAKEMEEAYEKWKQLGNE